MTSNILFVCPHGAAKSVLAAAYFNHLAPQYGLSLLADSAGTEPSDAISPAAIKILNDEGIAMPLYQPRHATHDALARAQRVISLGCTLDTLDIAPEHVEQWLDVPAVSEDPNGARDTIRARVEVLTAQLRT